MGSDRKVLITGGCGSVGSAIVAHLLEAERTWRTTIYDSDEHSLFALKQQVGDAYPELQFELGDVRDKERLVAAMRNVDYVIHTAGVKQVPQCESHPYEAMRTNADGTKNVIQAAKETDIESVITLSTDKAVNPTSVMGASKMLAERLTQAAADRNASGGPRLGCVRLGNVIGSAGSVVPLFKKQIEDGGPVTVTKSEMTRFAISKRQAAEFIVDCVVDQETGQIHAPKIGRLRLIDLAEAMIREYAPPGTPPADIDVETIGRRPGERAHEYLIGPTEINRTVEHEKRYSIEPPSSLGREVDETNSTDLASSGYRSDSSPFMDHDEIIKLIEDTTETWAASTTDAKSATVIGKND